MGILRHRKDTWTETLYSTTELLSDEPIDDSDFMEVFELCYKPYDEFDWYRGSYEYLLVRNEFQDCNSFYREGNSMYGYFIDRI